MDRPPAPQHGLTDAADVTRRRLEQLGGGFGAVVGAFAVAVGPELARVAHPVSLKDGTLRLRCSSSSWAQAVRFQERQILDRLRRELPDLEVTSIHAVAGAAPTDTPQRPAPTPLAPPDALLEQRLDALVAHIADRDLRASLRAAASAATRRGREAASPDQAVGPGD